MVFLNLTYILSTSSGEFSILFFVVFVFLMIFLSGVEGSGVDWTTNDIEVRIKETHEDGALIGQIGIIRSVSVGIIDLWIYFRILAIC